MNKSIGNDRLYLAVKTLVSCEKDVRRRVCIAMLDIDKLSEIEFKNNPKLWERIKNLRHKTSYRGPQSLGKTVIRDKYEFTALHRKNKTYSKFASEILSIWIETTESSQ